MKSLWNDQEAAQYKDDLGLRVYSSRLLGRDPSLVLHGGGNTSVKITERNIFGEPVEVLYVKGSGWDLETIDTPGFAPVQLHHLVALSKLERLSDPQMVNELKTHTLDAGAPTPSVEAILHAVLPYKYVDHTHADAIVTITNTADGPARIRAIYGDSVVVLPYVMPGFDLARECARCFAAEAGPQTIGMVLLNHGIFSFGATALESYERMIALVNRAEEYLAANNAWQLSSSAPHLPDQALRSDLAVLRRKLSQQAGAPLLLATCTNDKTLAFARHPEVVRIAQQGPATPDHVIRTKRLPMLGRDVDAYVESYKAYFDQYAPHVREPKTMLDPTPRVILDDAWGMSTVGPTARDAAIVADIYDHTMDVILRAQALGGYRALSARELFDMEYWDLEQAKLRKGGKPPLFRGEIALVTGAASGIGKACVHALLARGAAVAGLDIDPAVLTMYDKPAFHGIHCDVSEEAQLGGALEAVVRRFGGLDMLILNAGVFPPGRRIADLDSGEWRRVMAVNLDANLALMREAHPLLKLAPRGGRVVVIGSKNVPAPGPGAAAYSASKAALNQLARVAALEWGRDHVRVNSLHPNAVFDTALWSEEVLQARATHYGLSVEQYKTNNVLKVEVSSRDVAELAAEMCGPLFAKTTGAQVPVDGGNDRVI
ncbi:MAG: bifunctional aldolase/short-chain dehydrogenase [Gammaproteobacteria bacterium]|jgi:rhamnose utilization protein RhaD (predicted bifunctional aldolase and dehydrogenase)/NAD(P)-dependent dehydrogenase (short-subunit alcohol dehydrogenase family)